MRSNVLRAVLLSVLGGVCAAWLVSGGPPRTAVLDGMGADWSPEPQQRLSATGERMIGAEPHTPAALRLDELPHLELDRTDGTGRPRGRRLAPEQAEIEFPADGSTWRESGSVLVWRFPDADLTEPRSFGGLALRIHDRRRGDHHFHVSFRSRTATVPLVSGRSIRYVVRPDMSAPGDNEALLDPQTLYLVFPDLEDPDAIEISSVEVLSRASAYVESTGTLYEGLDDETRPAFYQWAPATSAWDLDIPAGDPVLRFGIGQLPNAAPARFSVSVEIDGRRDVLFHQRLDRGDAWSDQEVDLGRWRGRSVRLLLRAEADEPTVALWSSPRIVQTGRSGRLVCVFVIDALRPDFTEGLTTFRGRTTSTPNLRRIAEEGVRFDSAQANAPLTKYSVPALLTGLLPGHTGVMDSQRVPDGVETLAETFRENGYLTASFLFNPNSGRMRGLHQGFDRVYSATRLLREASEQEADGAPSGLRLLAATSGSIIGGELFQFLRQHRSEDVFLFLHVMDPHRPYLPDDEFLGGSPALATMAAGTDRSSLLERLDQWDREDPDTRLSTTAMIDLYRRSVRTADKHFGRFVAFLETEDWLGETTLVVTADHGEHLDEHPDAPAFAHMHPMYREVLAVPLIVRDPRLPRGRLVSQPVQLADVAPTLLSLSGIPYDAPTLDGTSLVSLMSGHRDEHFETRPIISQSHPYWSVRVGRFHSPDVLARSARVFDLDRDPREHRPLQGSDAEQALDLLRQSLRRVATRIAPTTDNLLREGREMDQLRKLGYVN